VSKRLQEEAKTFCGEKRKSSEGERIMKNTRSLAVGLAVACLVAAGVSRSAGNGAAAFEQLKSLTGHWEAEKTNDAARQEKATVDLEVTSGGSAVLEKFRMEDNGKPVEMITLYYLDGDQLKLTHYCMAGNQPTMVGTYAPETKTVKFDFAGITNLKSPDAGHMHHAVYTFIDNDHFKTRWTFRKNQQDAFTEEVTYVRTK
jgi:hypothetical protein